MTNEERRVAPPLGRLELEVDVELALEEGAVGELEPSEVALVELGVGLDPRLERFVLA